MHGRQYGIVFLELLASSCICNGICFTIDIVNRAFLGIQLSALFKNKLPAQTSMLFYPTSTYPINHQKSVGKSKTTHHNQNAQSRSCHVHHPDTHTAASADPLFLSNASLSSQRLHSIQSINVVHLPDVVQNSIRCCYKSERTLHFLPSHITPHSSADSSRKGPVHALPMSKPRLI